MRILIIDDEINILKSLRTFLEIKKHKVDIAETEAQGLKILETDHFDVLLLDLFLEYENQGFDILSQLRKSQPQLSVIIITGQGSVQKAVKAIHLGAFDFIEKPVNTDRLEILLRNIEELKKLAHENQQLKTRWLEENFILGTSEKMRKLIQSADRVAKVNHGVLIQGENGSGKELLSRYIYQNSQRSDKSFVAVNCAAIPQDLFESQLFGHTRGSFTGAHKDFRGFFERAHGGTLFLDEVAEIPFSLQAKLLRALESGEIQKLGGDEIIKVDVRLISASNRNLREEIRQGRFREDLFYRITQLELTVPSLKDRQEDIPALIDHFIRLEQGNIHRDFHSSAYDYLIQRSYPGNIRELKNLILRVMVLIPDNPVTGKHIESIDHLEKSEGHSDIFKKTMPLRNAKNLLEQIYLKKQMEIHHGSVKETALALGILPNNLSRRLKELCESGD
ncbi:MAG: sigma-54-dependent Fis family transcriptional regulator [Spirochaetales bacterium]|nr:sigma-54-dependent Fis family transcriptional regulator [Spirochaetales bacterium]